MRVLVTGDREWGNYKVYGREASDKQVKKLRTLLQVIHKLYPDTILVEGDARGADKIAGAIWTELCGHDKQLEAWPADWTTHGRRAGPIRNQFMLDESNRRAVIDGHFLLAAIVCHPDLERSKGTRDMVYRLDRAGIDKLRLR